MPPLKKMPRIFFDRTERSPHAGVLARMNREGLIAFTGEEGRRKNYAITETGRTALLAEYRRLKRLVADGALLEEGEP